MSQFATAPPDEVNRLSSITIRELWFGLNTQYFVYCCYTVGLGSHWGEEKEVSRTRAVLADPLPQP